MRIARTRHALSVGPGLALLVVSLLAAPLLTLAAPPRQGGDVQVPCGVVPRNPDGTLDTDDMTYEGAEDFCVPPLCTEITDPITGITIRLGVQAAFHRYVDADGTVYYIPTTITAIYMAISGWSPFPDYQPDGWLMNGLGALIGALGGWESLGISRDDIIQAIGKDPLAEALTDGDWQQVFQELGRDALFWLNLNLALNQLALQNGDALAWFGMVLVYCKDPVISIRSTPNPNAGTPPPQPPPTWWRPPGPTSAAQTPIPPGPPPPPPPPPPPNPTPPAVPPQSPGNPRGKLKTDPLYPVVVRQDPYQRGVDIIVDIVVPPCEFVVPVDVWTLKCNCIRPPAPPGQEGDECTEYLAECGGSGPNARRRRATELVTFTYPRPFRQDDMRVFQAKLAPHSKAYIEGPLQIRFPGMPVYEETWDFSSWRGWNIQTWIDDELNFHWHAERLRIPFEDPGDYNLTIEVRIPRPLDGGQPVMDPACAPQVETWTWKSAFHVYYRDETLTR